jgi:hypothetical protein
MQRGGLSPRRAWAGMVFFLSRLPAVGCVQRYSFGTAPSGYIPADWA